MGLFDIIDDIAEKQTTKTETGDNRVLGVVVGTVVQNYDVTMPGRLCVSVPSRDEGNQLRWARLAMPYAGSEWGIYFMPEVGDQVLVAFEQGNIERPYVIGCVSKAADKFLNKTANMINSNKRIVTHNGNAIEFEDNPGEGASDKITIRTAGKTLGTEHSITMDNAKHRITITDPNGTNKIHMDTMSGQMEIVAATKLTIKVGETIELTMNGASGVTELQTKDFRVNALNGIKQEAVKSLTISGGTTKLEGTAKVTVASNGPATVEGKPIKIG
ncbi:MAG: phage baseplate assembly protein V [bacterium]|nr:phage baseplate assembly protein V [bacterium]